MSKREEFVIARADELFELRSRRSFLRTIGLGGTIVLLPSVFGACSDDDPVGPGTDDPVINSVTLDLGSDTGILNLTYALEQVETTFYDAAVASSAFGSMSAEQREVLSDIRSAEWMHRAFLAAVLGTARIGRLALNQTAITTAASNTASIFRMSEMLEDTGVAALNGAGKYLQSAANLTIAGKLASVEARHVAAVRDIRESLGISGGVTAGTRFAGDDIVVPSGTFAGLDTKLEVPTVLSRVANTGFLAATVTIGAQPATKAGTPDFAPPNPTP